VQIDYQDKKIDVEEIEAVSSDEKWNTYKLADGKWLSIKVVLIRVFKSTSEKDKDGNDLYIIKSQNIVKVKE
jgi:hypothetical protein